MKEELIRLDRQARDKFERFVEVNLNCEDCIVDGDVNTCDDSKSCCQLIVEALGGIWKN